MVALFKWIANNKTKFAILYAIKALLFIPHVVEATTTASYIPLSLPDPEELPAFHNINNFGGGNYADYAGIKLDAYDIDPVESVGFSLCTQATSTLGYFAVVWNATSTSIVATSTTVTEMTIPDCATYASTTPATSTLTYFDFSPPVDVQTGDMILIRKEHESPGSNSSHAIMFGTTTPYISASPFYSRNCIGVQFTDTVGSCLTNWGLAVYSINGSSSPIEAECQTNPTSRILNFTPANGTTTSNPVTFDLNACIDPDDLGVIEGIHITLHNIDQNVLFIGGLSPSDIFLYDDEVETSGLFNFSTTTTVGEGNYRIEACIRRSYFSFFNNPFSPINDCDSHQFIVGAPTFIGNISQTIWEDTNDFYEGLTATSSEALASSCNPLSGNFEVRKCTAFLFIPDASTLRQIMNDAREGILTRAPWGYFNRVYTILSNPTTATLPSWTSTIQLGPGSDETPETTTITIDPGDMLAGGGALLASIHDPITDKTARDVFEPMVRLVIALAVVMTIIVDLTASHRHMNEDSERKGKLS